MLNLQNAVQEGALSQMIADAIASINYNELLTKIETDYGNLQETIQTKI